MSKGQSAIGWGVVGGSGIADRRTIPEGIMASGNAQLVGVCGRSLETSQRVAEKYPPARAYPDLESMLADDEVRAVYIATPNNLHREECVAAARAGKHVLCEKPLACTVPEAEEIVRACEDYAVLLGTAFMMRFHGHHQKLLRLVREGRLGAIVAARAQCGFWYPPMEGAWRQVQAQGGGGALMDVGSHCVDLLEMLLGRVQQVQASIDTTVQPYETDDTALLLLEFGKHQRGFVDVYFNLPAAQNRVEVNGTEATAVCAGTIGQGSGGTLTIFHKDGTEESVALQEVNTYRAEIEDFSEAVLIGRTPAVDGRQGLHNLRVLMAAYESSAKGARIEVTG